MTCRWTRFFRRPDPRELFKFFAPLVCLLIAAAALYAYGVRVNLSPSLPRGIWQIQKGNNLRIGDSVVLDKSAIPNNRVNLVKDVGALPKDVMTRQGDVVYRNGIVMPLSTIHAVNSNGEKIYCVGYPVVVPAGHIWLSSRHERGYDSRYFGPVPIQHVIGKVKPLWVW